MPVSREILFLQDAAEKIASLNASVSSAPVEEGEVSSSNPPILATEQFEPALQELQGFLFILNFQGKIVSVTDNVTNYLGYQPSEWPDASIYDFLHVTNHASFSQNMLSRLGDGKACLNSTTIIPPFPCRMRPGTSPTVMSPTDGMGKKTDSESLIHVQISSLPFCIERLSSQSSSSASGSSLYLVCIAQKVDDPIAMWSRPVARSSRRFTPQPQSSFLPISSTKSSAQVDFAMQLNLDWLILHCDFRGMSEPNDLSSRFIGKKFTNFVHNNDLTPFQKYADTVVRAGATQHSSPSNIYRFKLTETRNVFVYTRAQVISSQTDGTQAIFSKHSIVRNCESSELKGSASTSLMKAIIQSKTQNSSVAIEGVSPGSRHTTSFERSSTTYSLNSAGQTRRDQGGQTQGGQTQGGQTQGGQTPGGQTQGGQGGEFRHRYHSGEPTQSTSNMMSGLPQTPDFNFNDIYTSRMGTTRMDLDPYDNRMAWDNNSMTLVLSQHSGGHEQIITEGASHLPLQGVSPMQTDSSGLIALESKSHMQSVTSFNSYQSQTAPMSQSAPNGKLRELLSSVGTTSDVAAADASCLSPSHRKSPNQSGARLRKLLGTEEEGDFAKMDLSFSLRVNNSASLTSTDVTALTTSSPTSTSSKGTDQYQLLKKLLSEESRSEENERSEQDSILQKLFKQDENGVEKKSLSALSPDSSGVSSTRRHNSGGSSKDSKASSEDISARGTKRKISSSSAPLLPTSTAQTTACHDTSASTALLTHLLTKPLDNLTKVEACEITATPLEKRKAQKNKSNQSCNVVDVIDNKIMHGTEQINMERFTAIDSMVDATNYHRQNSGIYANGAVYSGHQVQQASSIVPDAPLTDMPRVPEQPLADMSGVTSYISNDSKDFFHSNLPPSLSSRSRPPMDFAESNRFENMESNSSASVLQHLLSPDSDNLIIQELENLLGGDTSMQLTSPEDEKAIKDIEKQLLYGTESFPGAPSEPHSPGFSLGLTNVPASASNPARATAIYNIHHKPQMSSMSSSHNMQSYDGPSHAGTQQQSGLRSHLQQGMVRPGMTSMRATHKSLARQGSGPAISSSRSLSQSAEVKIRRRSGNSPSSFSPLSTNQLGQKVQNNYPIPSNFGELMKSTDPPPNVKLPQDLNSNTFGLRTSDRIRHDGSTPHTSRVQGPASFSHSPMDLPSSPQHFRFPDQFGTGARGAPQRPLLGGQATGSYHAEHLNFLPSQQQMSNKGDLHSPQTIRSGPMENPGNTLTSTVHPLSSGTQANLPNLPQYSHVNQWILNQRASSNSVSNSQFVKQDLKAVITARAQKQIASPQNQKLSKQHVMGMMSPSAAQNSSMSSEPFSTQFSSTPVSAGKADDDSVLPDDILDQITELTDTQNEIQQNHIDSIAKSNSIPDEVPMTTSGNAMITNEHDLAVQHLNQYKKDYTALRNEYRELVGDTSHQSQGALGQVFRKQLSKSKQKNNLKSPTEPLKSEKLKQHTDNTPVNVITMEPRPPIQEMQPNDQRGSVLLLQLLTEDVVT